MAALHAVASKLSFLGLLALLAPSALAQSNPCVVQGIDFQDKGSYFQNSLSTDPFTFVQKFFGCDVDVATNLLVGPDGDQLQCSDTPLQPPDTNELSTCPILKDQLTSGPWSILVLSNNGNEEPIAYQRDFNLTVGPQITTTYTPTVTVPTTITPVVNSTTTYTETISTTKPTLTTTVPKITLHPTKTITPKKVTTTKTKTLFTITKVKPIVTVIKTTKTITASCHLPPKPTCNDKKAKIVPTIPGMPKDAVSLIPKPTSKPKGRYRLRDADVLGNMAEFLAERAAYLAEADDSVLIKRAPDVPVITLTDTNEADYPTITSTYTAAPSTATVVLTASSTTTITPAPVTIYSGKTVQWVTKTAPTPTRTVTKFTTARTTISKTIKYTVTIKTTIKPRPSATACRKQGGKYY